MMKVSLESLQERIKDKVYIILSVVFIAVQVFVTVFPQLKSILPEGWQMVAIFLMIWLMLDKTVKISDELKTKINTADISKQIEVIDKKMDNKRSSSLLKPGTAWKTGGNLIKELVDGDIILACNLVSWNSHHVSGYINANKDALINRVKIKRLYADNKKNRELAKQQSEWIETKNCEGNFERKMYKKGRPMLDYILATDSGNKPKWAVLWIYTPEEKEPSLLFGFHIIDEKSLEEMKKDFDEKWNNSELATKA